MESRLRLFLLIPLLAMLSSGCALFGRKAAEDNGPAAATVVDSATGPTTTTVTEPVIDPNIERRKVKTPKIGSENFELGVYGGILSIEDFGTHSLVGARVAYHVTESFFLEANYGQSKGGLSSAESLFSSIRLMTDSQRKYSYYALSAGWNALPGEIFIGENRAYNTALYLIAGVGRTSFANDERFTINGGFGYRILLTDWLATHLDVRDYVFDSVATGDKKVVNNLEASLGLSFFF